MPATKLRDLDELVELGGFESRAEALRAGIDALLSRLRELQLAEEYRDAYRKAPQEEWIGEVSAELAAEALTGRRRD